MALPEQREQARALRKRGLSMQEITLKMKVPKSTVSYWCRDIALSHSQIRRIAKKSLSRGRIGALRAAERKRALRIKATKWQKQIGRKDVAKISQRDLFMLGAALYWGEGNKSGNEECGLTNSSPDIIRIFMVWLKKIYGIEVQDLMLRVSINQLHRERICAVERYWSELTKVPLSQFTKPSIIKAKSRKIYKNRDEHFGTLRVKVRRGTALRRRIIGSLEEIGRQVTQ